ncbi:MAG: DUF7660 family protein [Micromonosporaceae bacterium]
MPTPHDTGRFAEVTQPSKIRSHDDAAEIVDEMLSDLQAHPDEWENPTLERFLEALAASLRALPALHDNRGTPVPDPPTWKLFTEVLVMASGYE